MRGWILVGCALTIAVRTSAAQQWESEGHASYSRTTQSHTPSWGAGAQVAGTWGGKSAPIQIGMSVGGDWLAQEHGGPNQWSVSWEPTVQPGGEHPLTPYVGGSFSSNWYTGSGAPSGALLGLESIFGLQWAPESQSPIKLKFEFRPGYVHTQEHSTTWRFGMSWSL